MTSQTSQLEFGVFVTPDSSNESGILDLAALADVIGLDRFTIQDHPYQARFLDAWTLLTTVAARSTSVRPSTNVTNLPSRSWPGSWRPSTCPHPAARSMFRQASVSG